MQVLSSLPPVPDAKLPLLSDVVFRRLFEDVVLLRELLNALLRLQGTDSIVSVTLPNVHIKGRLATNKEGVLDLHARCADGRTVTVEIQLASRSAYLARAIPVIRRLAEDAMLSSAERALVEDLVLELPEIADEQRQSVEHLRNMTSDLHQFLRGARPDPSSVQTEPLGVIRHAMGVCQEVAVRSRGLLRYDGPDTLPAVRMSTTELTDRKAHV